MKANSFALAATNLAALLLTMQPTWVWAESPPQIQVSAQSAPGAVQPHILQAAGVYRGSLGQKQIQLTLRPKSASTDSLVGEYFIFGEGQVIQLVAEIEPEGLTYEFWAEESRNGSDVSGEWQGSWRAASANATAMIEGTWRDENTQQALPIQLNKVALSPPAKLKSR